MKTIKLIAAGIILLLSNTTQAQVSVNLNIGVAPSWGPSGYVNVDYYYLPDVQAYYDIRASQFIYFGSGRWVRSRYLPRQYRNYDLYNGYKVVLNGYQGNRPYAHFHNHRKNYNDGHRYARQRTIGYRNDNHRYTSNRRFANNHRESNNRGNYKHNDRHENRQGKGGRENHHENNNRRN